MNFGETLSKTASPAGAFDPERHKLLGDVAREANQLASASVNGLRVSLFCAVCVVLVGIGVIHSQQSTQSSFRQATEAVNRVSVQLETVRAAVASVERDADKMQAELAEARRLARDAAKTSAASAREILEVQKRVAPPQERRRVEKALRKARAKADALGSEF